MIFTANNGKSFTKDEAIDLMVSLSATDANSEKKWRGFYISFSGFMALRRGEILVAPFEFCTFISI